MHHRMRNRDERRPDGTRKRRFSVDIAKRTYFARHRQARFARRFGGAVRSAETRKRTA